MSFLRERTRVLLLDPKLTTYWLMTILLDLKLLCMLLVEHDLIENRRLQHSMHGPRFLSQKILFYQSILWYYILKKHFFERIRFSQSVNVLRNLTMHQTSWLRKMVLLLHGWYGDLFQPDKFKVNLDPRHVFLMFFLVRTFPR